MKKWIWAFLVVLSLSGCAVQNTETTAAGKTGTAGGSGAPEPAERTYYTATLKDWEWEEEQLLTRLLPGYEQYRDQVERETTVEGTFCTLHTNGAQYRWITSPNSFSFQVVERENPSDAELDEASVITQCSQMLKDWGLPVGDQPEVIPLNLDGSKVYQLDYSLVYERTPFLGDYKFESPYDSEEMLTGAWASLSYDADGVRDLYIGNGKIVREVLEEYPESGLMDVEVILNTFRQIQNSGREAWGQEVEEMTVEESQVVYVYLPDPKADGDLMKPAWLLDVNVVFVSENGERTTEPARLLADAVTGYILS